MDNNAIYELIDSNKRLIQAMGMHWANEQAKTRGEELPYSEGHFHNEAWRPY